MELYALFLETLRDLERRVVLASPALRAPASPLTPETEYNTLMIAPLLRKLLVDGSRLVDQANRVRRLDILYPVRLWPIVSGTSIYLPMSQDADAGFDFVSADLPRQQMLATTVIVWNGFRFSALEVIRHMSNVEGGVHYGAPGGDRGRVLSGLRDIVVPGQTMPLSALIVMGRVVLDGLAPLRSDAPSARRGGGPRVAPRR